jgi:hypothetical protein
MLLEFDKALEYFSAKAALLHKALTPYARHPINISVRPCKHDSENCLELLFSAEGHPELEIIPLWKRGEEVDDEEVSTKFAQMQITFTREFQLASLALDGIDEVAAALQIPSSLLLEDLIRKYQASQN